MLIPLGTLLITLAVGGSHYLGREEPDAAPLSYVLIGLLALLGLIMVDIGGDNSTIAACANVEATTSRADSIEAVFTVEVKDGKLVSWECKEAK